MALAPFERDGELLVPSPSAVSAWSREMVNGHHIGGLIAWGALRDHADPDMQLSRLTVDMFRPVPMKPLQVRTNLARAGRRIRLVETAVFHDDVEVARGSTLMLGRSADPPGLEPWPESPWDVPAPEELARSDWMNPAEMSWELRWIEGQFAEGRGRAWVRELAPFVEGEDLAPALRACLAADLCHPVANGGRQGLTHINADVTLYLARDPVGEWIGVEATGHTRSAGIAVGRAAIHDRTGRIGEAAVAAIPDGRMAARASRRAARPA